MDTDSTPLGATHDPSTGTTSFLVWAPAAEQVDLVLGRDDALDDGATGVAMDALADGYHGVVVEDAPPGTRYRLRLHREGEEPVLRSDPASRHQPDGLHGPSAVDDPGFAWSDAAFRSPPLAEQVVYELHVGTFTEAGTFDGVVDHLDELAELGVTTLELMPVAQFPGGRNWGYDGVLWYAVQDTYGGPEGLRRLVDAAHARGLSVLLDAVYNHLGPEGNHLADFGPYFTDRVATPWGDALNLDGPGSDHVRRFVVENAVRWCTEFHLDGLRLDAVHALHDQSAVHVLEELATRVHDAADRRGARATLVAESDLQDPRVVRPPALGGLGLDAQWLDDVHHAVHVAVTDEREGYYGDYAGLSDLAAALRDRYAIAGRHSAFRGRTVGRPGRDVPHRRFVVCTQNHDQVGNRMLGERLHTLVGTEAAKAAAAAVLLSPFTPMLWMGQEYAEPAPFQYFVSHTDPDLVEAVRTGRAAEFAYFAQWRGEETPDPQAEATFAASTLDQSLRSEGEHALVQDCHRALLAARRDVPALADPRAGEPAPRSHGAALSWTRTGPDGVDAAVVVNPSPGTLDVALDAPGHGPATSESADAAAHGWRVLLDTADAAFGGPGGSTGSTHAPATDGPLVVGPRRTLLLVATSTQPDEDRTP